MYWRIMNQNYYQTIVDNSAKRMIEQYGVNPDDIEDAYALSEDVERRIAFQSFIESFVDQAVSSTINLPEWGSQYNNERTSKEFGKTLYKYIKTIRGITCYPNNSRGGQPLVKVPYSEAIRHEGVEILEYGNERSCVNGVCGL